METTTRRSLATANRNRAELAKRCIELRTEIFRRGGILDDKVPGWPWKAAWAEGEADGLAVFAAVDDESEARKGDPAAQLKAAEANRRKLSDYWQTLHAENTRRGELIAVMVLGWSLYHVDGNDEQMAYGPDEATVKARIGLGDWLSKLVDEAIAAM